MQKLITTAISLATIILAGSYAFSGQWEWTVAVFLVGLFWLSEPWHKQRWASTVGLIFFTTFVALGALWEFPALWLLTCLVMLLIAWDLSHFATQLNDITDIRNEDAFINAHLRRLGIVAGLGWLLGVVALNVQLTFGLMMALLLGFAVMISLSRVVRYMRRESD